MPRNCRELLARVITISSFVFLVAAQCAYAAGSGVLEGRVFDKQTKSALPGANVLVKGTSTGASTDLNGAFRIDNAPAGEQTIVVSYVGYKSVSEKVKIPENGTLRKDFYLTATGVQGKVVVVTAQAEGQIQAINQQLASNKIVNIVSSAKIQSLPDFDAASAIGRLPGVSVVRSNGEATKVVINGLAPQYNEVAINGITLSSTGSDQIGATSQGGGAGAISNDRSVDLAMVTPYMIKSIEVYKDLTPDMNANAVGGYVNMQLREAPPGLHTDLLWQSGYTQKTNSYGNYRAIASASDRFFDNKFGVYALFDDESYDRNADNMNASYGIDNAVASTNGYAPVLVQNVTLDRHVETRQRYGGNLILDYKLPSGFIRSINMVSQLASQATDYQQQLDYTNHKINFTYQGGNNSVTLAVNSLEMQKDFGFMSVDLLAANTYSRNLLPPSPVFSFVQTLGVGAATVNTVPQDLTHVVSFLGPANSFLTNVSLFSSDYKENDQHYKADFKIPFTAGRVMSGFFKFGGEFRYNYHTNAQATPYAALGTGTPVQDTILTNIEKRFGVAYDSTAGAFPASEFTSNNASLTSSFLSNEFGPFFWAANPSILNDVVNYIASTPKFSASGSYASVSQPGGWFDGLYQNLPNDYKYIDRYYAAYAMAQFNVGNLMVVGGARFEQEKSLYQAFNLFDNRNPLVQKVDSVTVYPQNHFLLPMVQAKYDITNWLDVRYAYTQTLARPAYSELSPHMNMDYTRNNVWAGNPNLVPGHAFNHDLILTAHSDALGLFSIDAFYKTIKNFTYSTTYKLFNTAPPGFMTVGDISINGIPPNPFANFYTYVNSKYLAYVKGVGINYETRFWYLPGAFSGLLAGINFTLMTSSATYPYIDTRTNYSTRPPTTFLFDSTWTGRLVDQPNNLMNAYIGYDFEGFSARLSFLFQGNSVSYVGNYPETDGFTENYFRMDAQVRQELPLKGLQLFFDANNLNSEPSKSAQISIDGFTSQQYYGLTADLGIRYTL